MLYITKELLNEIINHCRKEYPRVGCGILAGKNMKNNNKIERVILYHYKIKNVSETPHSCYFMDPIEQIKVMKEIKNKGLHLSGIYHSHINTQAYPSKKDCELVFYLESSYIIVSFQDINNPIVRAFIIKENKDITEEEIIIRKKCFICMCSKSGKKPDSRRTC